MTVLRSAVLAGCPLYLISSVIAYASRHADIDSTEFLMAQSSHKVSIPSLRFPFSRWFSSPASIADSASGKSCVVCPFLYPASWILLDCAVLVFLCVQDRDTAGTSTVAITMSS